MYAFLDMLKDPDIQMWKNEETEQVLSPVSYKLPSIAITERKWCDFVVYTTKDLFIHQIKYNEDFWNCELLPKLIEFYDCCLAPAIVSPVHIMGMQ